MHIGFDLKLDFEDPKFYIKGISNNERNKLLIKKTLESYLGDDGFLDGSKMQENWFPQVEADIFISHSHKDEKLAITLAGWLYENFGIKTFIDSCIWGYSNELLLKIDKKYCLNEGGETFCYEKRNYSTSHIHMMLSTALNMMIDKTECLFFLNTPSSINLSDVVDYTTSPWIYSEIATSKIIRKKSIDEYRPKKGELISKGEMFSENLKIKYKLDLNHLIKLNENNLVNWLTKWKQQVSKENEYPLDILYKIMENNQLL